MPSVGVCSLLIKNGFWGISGFNFFDSFAGVSLMPNTWGTQKQALRTLSLGNMVLVGRRGMDGESGRECFRRCLTSLDFTWLQKEGKSGWEKQVKKKKDWERERELVTWRTGKIFGGWVPSAQPQPCQLSQCLIITFYRELLFSFSCPLTLGFLSERRSRAFSTQWVHLGDAGWDEGEQHPNFHQRPKQPFKFKGGKTQLILEARCGPSRNLISTLPHEISVQNAPVVLQIVISLPCRGLRGAQV